MTEVDKFRADARRAVKRERAESGAGYDALRACRKIAEFFCKSCRSLGALPQSIGELWLEEHIAPCAGSDDAPTEAHIDWLAAALSFLHGDAGNCGRFSHSDWQKIARLVSYEAEELPVDELSALMGILLEKKAL